MSKILKVIAILSFVFGTNHIYSQTEFGLIGGVNLTFFDVIEGDFGPNAQVDVGYYGGFFADFEVDKDLHIQPELIYIGIADYRFLNLPIYLKYDVSKNFHLLIGPSFNYFFDFFVNKFKVRADLSLAFDLTNRLNLHLKYTIGIEELSPDVIFFGLGYRL